MSFISLLNPDSIQIGTNAKTKKDILKELASLAKQNKSLEYLSEEDIFNALDEREKTGSTGFENGIAIPHCSFENIDEFAVGILVVPNGIDFNSLDGKKTTILFFIVGPRTQRNKHIKILSAISKVLRYKNIIQSICNFTRKEDLVDYLHKIFKNQEFDHQAKEKSLFQVIVQDNTYFEEILQIFSSVVEGSVTVIDGRNAGFYLHRLPLFSAFWNDSDQTSNKIIIAVLDKALCNDVIRRIHIAAEELENKPGILITVQELSYAFGSLDF
ncbi:MAG: PTS sugar transporter subunit IIA [Spirochaetales bacterium]|nr:PTS sugar transporter subunit IIA [Spirochaetales bacterium]